MHVEEITTYLEMTDSGQLRASACRVEGLELRQAKVPCPELNRFFYTAVGGDWYWVDRLGWTYDQWLALLGRPGFETWFASIDGTPAGYFELDGMPGPEVEIASFGLLPQFIGRGIGGWLLTVAVRQAWSGGARRVWLHTSSLDHPKAKANYLARGFRVVKAETSGKDLPDCPPGPWPGVGRRGR